MHILTRTRFAVALCSLITAGGMLAPSSAMAQEEFDPVEVSEGDDAGGTSVDSGWFRVDSDSTGLQFWAGTTFAMGGLDIATDIYLLGSIAEFDIGPKISFGDIAIVPMAGLVFDFAIYDIATLLAPQLYVYYTGDIYVESWLQFGLRTPFNEFTQNYLYTRNFVLYPLADWLQVGPQLEAYLAFNETAVGADDGGLLSMPIGARVNLAYGKNSTLGLFLGYETQDTITDQHLTGRFSYIHTWGE